MSPAQLPAPIVYQISEFVRIVYDDSCSPNGFNKMKSNLPSWLLSLFRFSKVLTVIPATPSSLLVLAEPGLTEQPF